MNLQFFRDSSLYATLPSVGLVPNPPSKVRNTTARPFLRSTAKALKKENIRAVSNFRPMTCPYFVLLADIEQDEQTAKTTSFETKSTQDFH